MSLSRNWQSFFFFFCSSAVRKLYFKSVVLNISLFPQFIPGWMRGYREHKLTLTHHAHRSSLPRLELSLLPHSPCHPDIPPYPDSWPRADSVLATIFSCLGFSSASLFRTLAMVFLLSSWALVPHRLLAPTCTLHAAVSVLFPAPQHPGMAPPNDPKQSKVPILGMTRRPSVIWRDPHKFLASLLATPQCLGCAVSQP